MNTKMSLLEFVEFYSGLLLNSWNQASLNNCIVLKTLYILLWFCPIEDKPLCMDIIVVFEIILFKLSTFSSDSPGRSILHVGPWFITHNFDFSEDVAQKTMGSVISNSL